MKINIFKTFIACLLTTLGINVAAYTYYYNRLIEWPLLVAISMWPIVILLFIWAINQNENE